MGSTTGYLVGGPSIEFELVAGKKILASAQNPLDVIAAINRYGSHDHRA